MINIRKAQPRDTDRRRKESDWHTLDPDAPSAATGLERVSEERLPPGASASRHPVRDGEMITWVREGTLAWEDGLGRSGLLKAGEFQRMTVKRSVPHSKSNASRTAWAQAFQIWLGPAAAGFATDHEQKRFSSAQRRGSLCVIASPDARAGSLRLHQDTLLYSALLAPGQHIVHELGPGRRAWLQVVRGRVTLNDNVLSEGDGARLVGERVVSLRAIDEAELIMIDLHPDGVHRNDAAESIAPDASI